MKKITRAMSEVSDIYIDELKNADAPMVRRHSFRTILVAATLAAIVVCASLFAMIGSKPPEAPYAPSIDSEALSQNMSIESNVNSDNTSNKISDTIDSSDESSSPNLNYSNPNENSFFDETSSPDENSDHESSWNPPYIDENGADFTAQQIAEFFTINRDIKTNQYEVMDFKDVSGIKTGAIPQADLPMLLESDWEYQYQKLTIGGMEDWALYLDGKTIILPVGASYEEAYSIALEWLPHCQNYFGFEYSDIEVYKIRGTVGFYIYYFDSSQSYPYYENGSPIMRTNSYLMLGIGSNVDSDIITLRSISYKAENNSFTEGEHFNTISLEEAEEMLKNGYVFGGHTCPLCMQAQDKIDFSDYDHVGIEYVQREYWTNEYYPFYAFYKEIEEGRYARTYVPAFRVSGLEEYFESQRSKHNSSGLIPA